MRRSFRLCSPSEKRRNKLSQQIWPLQSRREARLSETHSCRQPSSANGGSAAFQILLFVFGE